MKKIIILVVLLAVLGGGGAFVYLQTAAAAQNVFLLAEVKKGRLVATISSTGTLQPQELVDVGAQVVGRIVSIGSDPNTQSKKIDWGSEVIGPEFDSAGNLIKNGTLLAQIDEALYVAAVNAGEAGVKSAQADLLLKTAQLEQSTADWSRAQRLFPDGGIARAEYDLYKANFEVGTANIEVSKANIGVAQANLKTAQTNLDYAKITAPVSGVVIDRRVNVGQTVVASLSAPSLFLIAKDLSKMEVWATVNEVDVGKVRVGQEVKFTVDSFPGTVFHGKVVPQGKLALRLNATMNQNVVTYTVVVSVDNRDRKLSPYMTANLTFVLEDKKDALLVPNAALRWQPAKQQIAPDLVDAYNQLRGKKRSALEGDVQDRGFVWVKGENGVVRFIELRLGLSDSVNTEVLGTISGGDLPEHLQVIVGEGKSDSRSDSANPFAVQMFKAKPKE